jgi:hypothetical protein
MHTEILEKRCAEALLGYSQTMADAYTTEPEDFESTKAANDEPIDKLSPFDIRNARGIFTKAEYAVMNSQARRLLGRSPTNEITNNQYI